MELFGLLHFSTLATITFSGGLLVTIQRKGHQWPLLLLAFLNLVTYTYNQAVYNTLEIKIPLDNALPFHLCDIAAFIAGIALMTRHPLCCELTYCWGLAGTLQGLITPNLSAGFPEPLFFSFFLHHGTIVVTALFLPLALGWRPRAGTWPRVLVWNQVYFFFALSLNYFFETNFGFLLQKPHVPSLLDHLGPWPYYLIWLQVIAATLMGLVLLPFSRSINVWRFGGSKV